MSRLYPDEAVKAHRDGLIHIHRLDEPDKGYSAGWSISSLTDNKLKGDGLKGLLSAIMEPLEGLQREWAGPQAVNSLDVYCAAAIEEAEETDNEQREAVVGFVSNVQSLRAPLSVSLDLCPDATMPASLLGLASCDPQTLGVHMDRFNGAFADTLEHGYGRGEFKLVPVLNVTGQTDWRSEILSRYVALSYKYGYPTIQNYYTGTLHPRYLHEPEAVASDKEATYLRHGGVHGNSDNQGCLSVVTLNLPRLSRLSRTEDEFFRRLDEAVDLARAVHESKRRHLEEMLSEGRLPETAKHLDSLDWHFSSVNVVGMNEALLQLIGAGTGHVAGKAVTYRLLEHLIWRIEEIQVETGHVYTLEAAPCEEAGAKMAMNDAASQPGGVQPYYTGSTELPPWHGDDLWDAMEHQKKYHGIYTGGNVFQIHLARGLGYRKECKLLLRRAIEVFGFNHMKVSPVFSLCGEHGYLWGEQQTCPVCGGDAEAYTWVDCSPRALDELSEGLKEAHRRRVYSDVKDR
jgi:anaerobic ribonucleoside-triphosphate reductase